MRTELGHISALFRYPIKSMAGTRLESAQLGWHGIEGVLKEELLDLSAQPAEEIDLLRVTPAAGSIGTCRYKLRESQKEDFDRIRDARRRSLRAT